MDWQPVVAWITGIGAILSAGAGVGMIWREVKSRQHKEIKRLDEQVADLQEEIVAMHRRTYDLQVILADHGIDIPDDPERPRLQDLPNSDSSGDHSSGAGGGEHRTR